MKTVQTMKKESVEEKEQRKLYMVRSEIASRKRQIKESTDAIRRQKQVLGCQSVTISQMREQCKRIEKWLHIEAECEEEEKGEAGCAKLRTKISLLTEEISDLQSQNSKLE